MDQETWSSANARALRESRCSIRSRLASSSWFVVFSFLGFLGTGGSRGMVVVVHGLGLVDVDAIVVRR